MESLEKLRWFRARARLLNIPIQTALTFVLFGAMVPVGCALFPQKNTIRMTTLVRFEPSAYSDIHQKTIAKSPTAQVYFNKGL